MGKNKFGADFQDWHPNWDKNVKEKFIQFFEECQDDSELMSLIDNQKIMAAFTSGGSENERDIQNDNTEDNNLSHVVKKSALEEDSDEDISSDADEENSDSAEDSDEQQEEDSDPDPARGNARGDHVEDNSDVDSESSEADVDEEGFLRAYKEAKCVDSEYNAIIFQ